MEPFDPGFCKTGEIRLGNQQEFISALTNVSKEVQCLFGTFDPGFCKTGEIRLGNQQECISALTNASKEVQCLFGTFDAGFCKIGELRKIGEMREETNRNALLHRQPSHIEEK